MRHAAVSPYEHAMRAFHFCTCEHAILLMYTQFGAVHRADVSFITNTVVFGNTGQVSCYFPAIHCHRQTPASCHVTTSV